MRCALVTETGLVAEVFGQRDALIGKFHPKFIAGLVDIPDQVQAGWVLHEGSWLSERPSPPPTADDFAKAIQSHVDEIAQSQGYADGVALAGYSTSTIPTWAAEAAAFIAWRDAVWVYAYTELAKVQGGQRAVPTIEQMIAELPSITWPGG